jgi:Sap, sulfolipid-1-addressing protein/Putative cyclase
MPVQVIPLALLASLYPLGLAAILLLARAARPRPKVSVFLAGALACTLAVGFVVVFALHGTGVGQSSQGSGQYWLRLVTGVPAGVVTAAGAAELSIAVAASGIVGRGMLLDVPRSRGVPWLEPGDHVTIDDLLAAEHDQRVRMGKGDILLVRVGHRRRRREQGPWDAAPSVVDGVEFPVHVLAINALGMHLLDYLQLDELSGVCERAGKWSFLCVVAPLRLPTGTGSPVNPIAIL